MSIISKSVTALSRQNLMSAGIVLVSILALSACNFAKNTEKNETQTLQIPPQAVDVIELQPQTITLVKEMAGRVRPSTIAEVRPQVDGIVLQRTFREGSDIEKGELLYRIDPAVYKAELASAKAALAQAQANLKTAKLTAQRHKELVASKHVSQQDYDDSDAQYQQAVAMVELARANVQRAEINLGYTEVKSPIAGRIGRSAITQGALVTANQAESMATIQQLDPIYVDITESSTQLLHLRQLIKTQNKQNDLSQDIAVHLALEDGTLYPHAGRLAFSEVTVNEHTGTVTLRVEIPNPEQWLLPGMFVRAKVDTLTTDDALLLPPLAVNRTAKGEPTIMVVSPQNIVERRILQKAEMVNGQWLIDGGVVPGERVIVGGLQKVFPGMPVQVVSKNLELAQRR